jgi:hypothetical protein
MLRGVSAFSQHAKVDQLRRSDETGLSRSLHVTRDSEHTRRMVAESKRLIFGPGLDHRPSRIKTHCLIARPRTPREQLLPRIAS